MLGAMHTELELRASELKDIVIPTIYFGGGTPSLLSAVEIQGFIDKIKSLYAVDVAAEITLEANPDDLSLPFLQQLRDQTEVNRLSIGLQSFRAEELMLMNRAHTPEQSFACVREAQEVGFDNISIDLIYGSPASDAAVWAENVRIAIDMGVQQISAYALTVEPGTLLQHQVMRGTVPNPDEAMQAAQYDELCSSLHTAGFEHYEISNFAKPGFRSRHNTGYWQNKPYLGIGPSAHSFDGESTRSWNVANNHQYIQGIDGGNPRRTVEVLSAREIFNECLMIGLRTTLGVPLKEVQRLCPPADRAMVTQEITRMLENGDLILHNNTLSIPENRWFFADGIASRLFLV